MMSAPCLNVNPVRFGAPQPAPPDEPSRPTFIDDQDFSQLLERARHRVSSARIGAMTSTTTDLAEAVTNLTAAVGVLGQQVFNRQA